MKRRYWTRPATASRYEIIDFIAEANPTKAQSYIETTTAVLLGFDERFLPHRPEPDDLPDVFQARVPGFAGYTVWVAVTDDAVAIVGAFRPGLSTGQKLRRARVGFADLRGPHDPDNPD